MSTSALFVFDKKSSSVTPCLNTRSPSISERVPTEPVPSMPAGVGTLSAKSVMDTPMVAV